MFPETARVIRETKPRAFVFENVRGLLRQSFAKYFEYIKLQLTYPGVAGKTDEEWTDHLHRLQEHHTKGDYRSLHYRVVATLVNAADFGVPQKRERVVIVGFRHDVQESWSFPRPTHSRRALEASKWVSGSYWDRHKVGRKSRQAAPSRNEIDLLLPTIGADGLEPWQTVRDALHDLPEPVAGRISSIRNQSRPIAGGRDGTGLFGVH